MNEVVKTIKERRSVRTYKDTQISDDDLNIIMEAACYAPSAHNDQSWHFTIIQNKQLLDKIDYKTRKIMANQDVDWVRSMGQNPNFKVFYDAPTVVLVSGDEKMLSPLVDCSAAIQNMILAAHSIGVGSCWIGLTGFYFEHENIDELEIPNGYKPMYCVALGYKQSDSKLKAPKRKENCISYIK